MTSSPRIPGLRLLHSPGPTHVPDAVYEEVRAEFAPEELVKLTLLITTINAWNRFAISFRSIHPVKPQAAAA